MNGRVYDYNAGRFLSVDPFVHEGSQGINPYSYIMNNPLSGTDPTGYKPEDENTKTVLKKKSGSRIKSKVEVTAQSSGNGGATISFSGSDSAAVNDVKSAVSGSLSKAGFDVADLGGQASVAKNNDMSSISGQMKSGPDDYNSFIESDRKGLNDALASVNKLREELAPFKTEKEAAVWLNENAGNLQDKYGAEVGAIISKIYGENTGWKIGDVVTSYHSNFVNLKSSNIRIGKMEVRFYGVNDNADWHTHSSGSYYASWGEDRDSHKSFYRAYVSSVGMSGKASLSLYDAPAARAKGWPVTRSAFEGANSCLIGGGK